MSEGMYKVTIIVIVVKVYNFLQYLRAPYPNFEIQLKLLNSKGQHFIIKYQKALQGL